MEGCSVPSTSKAETEERPSPEKAKDDAGEGPSQKAQPSGSTEKNSQTAGTTATATTGTAAASTPKVGYGDSFADLDKDNHVYYFTLDEVHEKIQPTTVC